MKYLLDTNTIIAVFRGHPAIRGRIERLGNEAIGLSSIVAHELFYGAYRSAREEANLARVDDIRLPIVEFDAGDARVSGRIRAALAQSGTPIGPYDALIAGQALARDLILVTHNVREFSRVPDLAIEDWEA